MKNQILDRVATPEEHAELARSVGWESHFDDRLRADALAASVAGVVCVDASGRVIGAARAVGDGLQYAYVQDVMVHPACNDDGIATAMVERLLELLQPGPGTELFVGLFASDAAVGVYESLGFTTEGAVGMHRRIAVPAETPGAERPT